VQDVFVRCWYETGTLVPAAVVEGMVIDPATQPFAEFYCVGQGLALQWAMPDDLETLTLRPTVIAGHRCEDDFVVIWRGMSSGAPHDTAQWTWSCRLHGRPQGSDERGSGADLDDAKAQFRIAWAQIRASLTDQDIASAHRIAEISTEALARYGRGRGR
jgi:hypothetical protein